MLQPMQKDDDIEGAQAQAGGARAQAGSTAPPKAESTRAQAGSAAPPQAGSAPAPTVARVQPHSQTTRGTRAASWTARLAVTLVFVVNVQCALSFIFDPASYMPGFELAGVAGEAAVRGLGVAFLMWNVTYPAVIAQPYRFHALFVVVLIQQAVGLLGESWILATLPAGHDALAGSIGRFITFDAFGLVIMGVAFVWLLLSARR